MKITIIADVYGQGNNGTSITAKRFVENLKALGHDVKVVSADENSDVVLGKRNFHCFKWTYFKSTKIIHLLYHWKKRNC